MCCVPVAWCVPTTFTPVRVWDDTGAGGGKAGSVWAINSMRLIAFAAGHEAPAEQFYELAAPRFFIEGVNSPPKIEK